MHVSAESVHCYEGNDNFPGSQLCLLQNTSLAKPGAWVISRYMEIWGRECSNWVYSCPNGGCISKKSGAGYHTESRDLGSR